MKTILSLAVWLVCASPQSSFGDIFLSDYLGGVSGGVVNESNAPFSHIVTVAGFGGFGVDTAGSFAGGALIDFNDTEPFAKGIGAHPGSEIDFDLNQFRNIAGFNAFAAVIGIDPVTIGNNGATFTVLLDGVESLRQSIADIAAGSVAVSVPIDNQSTLTLKTEYFGPIQGNHAAWANARLVVPPVVEPSTICQLDPRSTHLKPVTNPDLANLDLVQDAKRIDLASGLPFAVYAGDWLRLRAVGDFKFAQMPDPGPYGDGTLRDVFGVFSSNGVLLGETVANRVPGGVTVIEGNFDEVVSDPGNDIPGDFWIPTQSLVPGGTLVRVPLGATHLFLGAADTVWFDNSDDDNDFGVNITRIYAGRFLGDYNFNGIVDAADYTVWRNTLGQSGIDLVGDGNLDGTVNEADYSIWKEHFGQTVPGSGSGFAASTAIPEPSSVALAAAFAMLACGISFRCRAGA